MEKVIEVKNLVKKYGPLTAVGGISFDVFKGEVFGLLGENGAGKTTTLEMIEGLRSSSSGTIKVLGYDIKTDLTEIKRRIGVQLQSSAYYHFLNLKEILRLFCSFYDSCTDADELLKMVDLTDKAKTFVGNLSGGQKQRFSIIASLVNDPEVVFLDEPTTGLDPIARRNLWGIINKIKEQGKTIILTTHYMEEAEILCDRVAIMDSGKILALNDTHKLVENIKYPLNINFIVKKLDIKALDQLSKMGKASSVNGKANHYIFRAEHQTNLQKALKIINGFETESLTVGRATLEDVFIDLTGKNIKE
jgi:ABC-2 type transport system ATP-binding protein